MTALQRLAMEHVDELLIHAHNDAIGMDKPIKNHTWEMRSHQLAKDIDEIQKWCRVINSNESNS